MSAPNPPSEQQPQAQAPKPSPEDRILTPEETENLLRGYTSDATEPDDTPPDQQRMVQEFFSEIPPERTPEQMPPAMPPRPPGQDVRVPQSVPMPYDQMRQAGPPSTPPPGFIEDAVAQTMQAGGPRPQQQPPGQQPQYQPPGQQPQPGQYQQPPGYQPQAQMTPEMAALHAQNQLLQAQIQAMQMQLQSVQHPPTPQAPQAPQQAQMDYNFQVPPQYLAAIQSENPAEASYALNSLLNNVAQTVTNQIRQEQAGIRDEVQNIVKNQVGSYSLQQEVQRDMYGTYPELSPYKDFVQAAARQLSATMPQATPWSAELRDQIAERVSPFVPGLYQRIQQNRAQRMGARQAPQYPQYQQPLPQQQPVGFLPPGVTPVGVAGGRHMQPAQTLARDAYGNLVQVQGAPQPYLGSPQARQSGSAVSPEVMDIWRTLGYEPYQ